MVRQTADVLRRYGALEEGDYQKIQSLGRDMRLIEVTGQWFRSGFAQQVAGVGVPDSNSFAELDGADVIDQVLTLSMRPFLSRCAEVLQQRSELSLWTHAHCALCGGQPDLSVITPSAERHLICGRCELRWKWESLDVSVLPEQRALEDHVVRDTRRAVSRLRVRRVPSIPEGLRRAPRISTGDADGGCGSDTPAGRGGDPARLLFLV